MKKEISGLILKRTIKIYNIIVYGKKKKKT